MVCKGATAKDFTAPRGSGRVKILVFGAGAIGSFVGALLSIENEVTLVARAAHADAIRARGLKISGRTTLVAHPNVATEVPIAEFDAVFVTTKSYDTANAVQALQPLWRRTIFVTLQNGLGNAEALSDAVDRVLAGTTTHGVTFVRPGEVVHAGEGETVVGVVKGAVRADADHIADVLTRAGIATSVTDDVRHELWAKAIVNAAINPLTAVLRAPNGAVVANEDLRGIVERLAREGASAANDAGVTVEGDRIAAKAVEVARATADNRSSMLQDLERGRQTEIEAITGALLRSAAKGRRLPYTETVYALVRGLEGSLAVAPKEKTDPRRGNLFK